MLHFDPQHSPAPDVLREPEPVVSVVVVNWNRRELLEECLRSIALQEGLNLEVIVVDNGSSDGSIEAVERFATNAEYSVRLIRNDENRGFCAANNQAIAISRGRYIALINNDAEASPEWLAAMIRAMEADAGVGMVSCKILVWEDPSRIDKVGHLIWPDGQNRGRGTGQRDRGQFDLPGELLWPDGCAALYRKSMLDEIGFFSEELFAYGDDAELGMRGRLAGWKCVHAPQAVVRHHRGSTLGKLSTRRLQLIERNRVLLAVRHFPVSLLLQNPFWFAVRVLAGILAGVRGRGEAGRFRGFGEKVRLGYALVSGTAQALALIPVTWRKRLQFRREVCKLTDRQIRDLIFRYRISLRELSEDAA